MSRIENLKERMVNSDHKIARQALPKEWSTADMDCSITLRKAYAIKMMLDKMPVYIGDEELIVGTRTLYTKRDNSEDNSNMDLVALPTYLKEEEIKKYAIQYPGSSKGHYTAGYEKLLGVGIQGVINEAKNSMEQHSLQRKKDYLASIILVYEGLSNLINRYGKYAEDLAKEEKNSQRKGELLKISQVCKHIAYLAPLDLYEAAQLFWFSHLSLLIENYMFMNYGRIDQFLYPFYKGSEPKEAQQLIECLLLKMYDGVDLFDGHIGTYSAQHNITLGGITKEGEDGVNHLTYAILEAIEKIRLPEPQISIRLHSKNPESFLHKCTQLSVAGLNCIAYYNDDVFLKSMIKAGIKEKDANDYGFDLCQDITIPGRGDFFTSGTSDLTLLLLEAMKQGQEVKSFDEFMIVYKKVIAKDIKETIAKYNKEEEEINSWNEGEDIPIEGQVAQVITSPLPLTSALFEGCIETGTDLASIGCRIKDRGYMVMNPVIAINSLASINQFVFKEKRYTIKEILEACENNYEGQEILGQRLASGPKWGNDDDTVDLPGVEILEFACDEVLKHRTANGARHLAGIHQPHPVAYGRQIGATPQGRRSGEPIPVSLSPENGTMKNGPTAAFQSAAKINPMKNQWNNCVMLQYFDSVFNDQKGNEIMSHLIKSYFAMNGTQHQPNVVNVKDLRAAQQNPDQYKNLIVRLWGVSAHFIDLPKQIQEEFIMRYEG